MRRIATNLIMTMALCCAVALATAVEAKDRVKTVNFTENVLVNDKLIEKGSYKVRFDAGTNQVAIMKGREVVATAKAEVKMTDRKASYNSASFSSTERGKVLTAITFEGDKRQIILVNERGEAAE